MIVPAYPGHVVLLKIFMARKFGMGFFGGLILAQGFFWVLILQPFDHPCHLKSPPNPHRALFICLKKPAILFNTFFLFSSFYGDIGGRQGYRLFKVIIRGRREAISFVMAQHAFLPIFSFFTQKMHKPTKRQFKK